MRTHGKCEPRMRKPHTSRSAGVCGDLPKFVNENATKTASPKICRHFFGRLSQVGPSHTKICFFKKVRIFPAPHKVVPSSPRLMGNSGEKLTQCTNEREKQEAVEKNAHFSGLGPFHLHCRNKDVLVHVVGKHRPFRVAFGRVNKNFKRFSDSWRPARKW